MKAAPPIDLNLAKLLRACEFARRDLRDFVRLAWPTLNPSTALTWNWHLDAICEHLQAVTDGQIKRLLINVPPGHSKSTLVAQCWPVWEWLRLPHYRWGFSAYGAVLSGRDSQKRRVLIESGWYQTGFRPEWSLSPDQRVKTFFKNTAQGEMVATSVGGAATGFHYDRLIIDDPLKASEANTAALITHVEWYIDTWSSRKRDGAAEVVIMQRLHDKDLAGHLLRSGNWDALVLPERFEPKSRCATRIGWRDPRTQSGELLNPLRFDEASVDLIWKDMGPRRASAQRQQSPAVGGGAVFKPEWWRFWTYDGRAGTERLPERFDRIIISVDTAIEDKEENDYWAMHVLGMSGAKIYLLDRVHAQMRFKDGERALKRLCEKWPEADAVLVEAYSNGPAVIDQLKGKSVEIDARTGQPKKDDAGNVVVFQGVRGLVGVKHQRGESKEVRAETITGLVEAGDVVLPHESVAPWVEEVLQELADFPTALHDDEVDALVQGVRFLAKRGGSYEQPSMQPRARRVLPSKIPGEAESAALLDRAMRDAQRQVSRRAKTLRKLNTVEPGMRSDRDLPK